MLFRTISLRIEGVAEVKERPVQSETLCSLGRNRQKEEMMNIFLQRPAQQRKRGSLD